MTVTTNTLGPNSAEIVIVGQQTGTNESYLNVAAAVQSFLLAHGWYICPDSTITTTATGTNSSNNQITVGSTTALQVGMPITFGTSFGGISTSTTYYVLTIVDTTHITMSTSSYIQGATTATANVFVPSSTTTGTSTVTSGVTAASGNSTNTRYRMFYNYNLTGTVIKYVRLNLYDLTIDTTPTFSAAQTYTPQWTYTLGNPSYRFQHYYQLSFPRDSYYFTGTSPTTTIGPASISPSFTLGGNLNQGTYFASPSTNTLAITVIGGSSSGAPFYPGQVVAYVSASSGNYALATVTTYNDTNGQITVSAPFFATASSGSYSDWYFCPWIGNLGYNTISAPAYVYISASARHICIQTRCADGTWNDWVALTELENPTNATYPWGITTGYMSGSSGVTTQFANYTPQVYQGAYSTASYFQTSSGTITGTPSQATAQFTDTDGLFFRYHNFTGPFAVPYSYQSRTSKYASQSSKLVTVLGEAGIQSAQGRQFLSNINYQSTSTTQVGYDLVYQVKYKGMGDVMPTLTNSVTTKHWALTPSLTTDHTSEANFANLAVAVSVDNVFVVYGSFPANNQNNYPWQNTYNGRSYDNSYLPTTMGRLYNIKFVTSGLSALTTINIKVDSNGFTSTSGTGTDHLIFSYPSYYVSPDVSTNIGGPTSANAKPQALQGYAETLTIQSAVRTSQTVSVAFPK